MQNHPLKNPVDELQYFIHDIKSPLTNLGINLETLRNQLKDMPTNYEQSINSALRSLNYINNFVLTYNSDLGKNISWFNAREEVDYLISNHFEMRFNQSNIEFNVNSTGENLIYGNRFDFRKLVFNLLNNSCDSLLLSTNRRLLQLSISKQQKHIVVRVIDNGPGIADCSSIFKVGYTTKPQHQGIGLNLVTQIVQDFKGEITVKSKPFVATSFQLRFPV